MYVVKWIADQLPTYTVRDIKSYFSAEAAFCAEEGCTNGTTAKEQAAISDREKRYTLVHRRFGHMGKDTIRNLHQVTNHEAVQLPKEQHLCSACQISKIRQYVNHTVAERREGVLDSVSCDIHGPLPTSRNGNQYFTNLVDNATRKGWTICTPDRKSVPAELDKWKAMVELEIGKKLKALRVDNATELTMIVSNWAKSKGVLHETTEPYTSHQNGIAERSIQTTNAAVRTMLTDSGLPTEF